MLEQEIAWHSLAIIDGAVAIAFMAAVPRWISKRREAREEREEDRIKRALERWEAEKAKKS